MVMTEAKVWRRVAERNRVTSALLLSVVLHLGIYGGMRAAKRLGLEVPQMPKWVQKLLPMVAAVAPPPKSPEEVKKEAEERVLNLTFVEVDATQAVPEPPKEAKFYSTQSTRAANPEPPKVPTRDPNIDGKQTQVMKTIEVAKLAPSPSPPQTLPQPQPTPEAPVPAPAPPKIEVKQPEPPKPLPPKVEVARVEPPKPKPEPPKPTPPKVDPLEPAPPRQDFTELLPPKTKLEKKPLEEPRKDLKPLGDLALAKVPPPPPPPVTAVTPAVRPGPTGLNPNVGGEGDAPEATPVKRPRTLADARARMDGGMLIGEKMKQEGGVQRRGKIALDVRGSPFGAYDAKIIAAIQQAWYHLLADRLTPIGKVVIEFRLHANGRVSHLSMTSSEVGELYGQICGLAVQRPAPFDPWPREMRLALGSDYREVRFSFYYE